MPNQRTVDLLKANPHYKARPHQLIVDGAPEKDEEVKTFGVIPKQNTESIPKHPTGPEKRTSKKPFAKKISQ